MNWMVLLAMATTVSMSFVFIVISAPGAVLAMFAIGCLSALALCDGEGW